MQYVIFERCLLMRKKLIVIFHTVFLGIVSDVNIILLDWMYYIYNVFLVCEFYDIREHLFYKF